jgi:hypothetical protein
MDKSIKKLSSYVLVFMVLIITVISVLSIWDIISVRIELWKVLSSLFVIFVSSVVILFIFAVLIKDNGRGKES